MSNGMHKTLLKHVGGLILLLGTIMLLPMLVSIIYLEWDSALGFAISAGISFGIGFSLYRVFFYQAPEPRNKDALIIASSGWFVIAVLGALPFLLIAYMTPPEEMLRFVPPNADYDSSLSYFCNPLHALFESMSAFTTTGLTMVVHEPSVGKGILFYRSLGQWVGGAGFIVMALAVLKQTPGHGALLLFGSESSGEKLMANVIGTARAIWKLYFGLTVFSMVYLIIGTHILLPDYPFAENIFDSVNHAMTGQSTGGFSTLDDSIAGYNSSQMEMLYLLPMVLGSFSILFYFKIVYQGRLREIWLDMQTRALTIGYVLGGILLSLLLIYAGIVNHPVREGVFQFVSALSTTGWQTSNINIWDDVSVVFIVTTAMIIGGAAGATVGGIKVIRALLIKKGLEWEINTSGKGIFATRKTWRQTR